VIEAPAATGWYVYGIVDGAFDEGALGTDVVRDAGLAAVVAPVELAEFDESHLPERLNDRTWLEEKARAHEAMLSAVAANGPVVPLRFGAVYRHVDDVAELLRSRRDEFAAALERVSGRVEFGVKGWLDRSRSGERSAGDPATSGRAYLERRRSERDLAEEAKARIGEATLAAHERLLRQAVESVVNRPQSRELSGRTEQMVLNGAYLVSAENRSSFAAEVAALGEDYRELGLSFELTGPWPPYNFVGGEDE
jgi:Gas vesicle synthesis protein GvpL/GvpF